MESLHQFMRRKPDRQEPHGHDHRPGLAGLHGGRGRGSRWMSFAGMLSLEGWVSDYRSPRLVPVSNGAIAGSILALAAGAALWLILPEGLRLIGLVVAIPAALYALFWLVVGTGMVLFVRHVRSMIRQTVIGSIAWRGTEKVLDVGCGTGLLVNGCAHKLTTGKATGIDLWQEPVGGSSSVLMANARAEGVADKVDYREMDARRLEFGDGSFDVVVSSTALHHIGSTPDEVRQAVSEMIRVLAPGGSLGLADIAAMVEIAQKVIAEAGLRVTRREQTPVIHVVIAQKTEASGL